jgi:crotonobetainyl-CoA:carnitine CoA-transferase CaiB-like acyl-CoA transferase
VQARHILVEFPDEEIGSVTVHNVIPRLSATPGALRRPAPKLGDHTAKILARVGIGADHVSVLREEGIV